VATDATLTKTQKNSVFLSLRENRFDPGEFGWEEDHRTEQYPGFRQDLQVSKLVHRVTGYYFVFGDLSVTFSPGEVKKTQIENISTDGNPRDMVFHVWLRRLRQELDAPDLWATALQDRDFLQLTAVLQSENTPFTLPEQSYIADQLGKIRDAVIASAELTNDQRQLIETQIQYTQEAAGRLGRIDWKGVLVNTLITVAVTAVFTPDRTRQLFHAAAGAFMALFQAMPEMLH
jgi:hypothetical protein